jgi:hypothetical protein
VDRRVESRGVLRRVADVHLCAEAHGGPATRSVFPSPNSTGVNDAPWKYKHEELGMPNPCSTTESFRERRGSERDELRAERLDRVRTAATGSARRNGRKHGQGAPGSRRSNRRATVLLHGGARFARMNKLSMPITFVVG